MGWNPLTRPLFGRGGGAAPATPDAWETLLDSLQTETDGLVLYFTDPDYPRALVRESGTFGVNLVTNGTFAADSDWTKGGTWAISGGQASAGGTGGSLTQAISLVANAQYEVTYTVVSISSGNIKFQFQGGTAAVGALRTSAGTYTEQIVNIDNTTLAFVAGSTTPNAVVDNVTVTRVDRNFDGDANSKLTYTSPSLKNVMGADGTIKYANHNLCLQSQTFDNATWTKADATISANAVAAPDGTTTADALVEAATTAEHAVFQSITYTSGTTYTLSVYAKKNTRDFVMLQFSSASHTSVTRAWFDLNTGTVGTLANSPTATITDAGNGWYRCSITKTATGTGAANTTIEIASADGTNNYAGATDKSIYLWGAELKAYPVHDAGTLADYVPTTTAAKYRLPIEYDTAGDPVGLLVEEARTNLFTYSEDQSNANWLKNLTTVTANAVAAPDGTTTADKLQPSGAGDPYSYQNPTLAASPYTVSCYFKAAGSNWAGLFLNGGAQATAYFDLANGVVGTLSGAASGKSSSIIDVGNGWYRCVLTSTAGAGANACGVIVGEADSDGSWAGASSNGIYVWGVQVEAGSFPTSYIRTVAATVTRAADNISMATSAMPYSATAGYFRVDYLLAALNFSGNSVLDFRDSIGSNAGRIATQPSTASHLIAYNAAPTALADIDAGTVTAGILQKVAAAYESDNFGVSLNGGAAVTDTSGTLDDTQSTMWIGLGITGNIQVVKYLKRRVSNADLALESAL